MSLDVLMAAIKQKETLHPDQEVERLFISHEFHERLKLDERATFALEALGTDKMGLRLMGYPLTLDDLQPDFRIKVSPR